MFFTRHIWYYIYSFTYLVHSFVAVVNAVNNQLNSQLPTLIDNALDKYTMPRRITLPSNYHLGLDISVFVRHVAVLRAQCHSQPRTTIVARLSRTNLVSLQKP